MLMALWFQL